MEPHVQSLWDSHAAARTFLAGFIRIHLDEPRAGALCLVVQHRDEHSPRSIVDVLGQSASREASHVELFDNNPIVVSQQPGTSLMQVVPACSRRCRVATGDLDASPPATPGTSRLAGEGPLGFTQAPLSSSCRSQAGNEPAIGERSERGNPKVDANAASAFPDRRFGDLHHKSYRPATRTAAEHARLHGAIPRQWPVKVDAQPARQSFESQSAILEAEPGKLTKAEAIEPSFPAKPRKTGLRTGLNPPKERLVRIIKPFQCATLKADGYTSRFRVALPPLREAAALVDVRTRNANLAIRIYPLLEGGVIKLPLALQQVFERAMLALGRQEAVAVRDYHSGRRYAIQSSPREPGQRCPPSGGH